MPIAKGISVLIPDAPNFFPYCMCMFVDGEQKAVIDFGAGIRAFGEIDKENVDIGFITHYHPDHTHCGVLFNDTQIYAGKEEAQAYSSEEFHLYLNGGSLWNEFMKGKPRPEPTDVISRNPDIPVQPGFIRLDLAGTFTDGQRFDLGRGLKVTAVHLPGHSIGHYGFYFEKEGILFSADIDTTRGGPWYGSGCSNVGQFIHSVERIKEIDPTILASSHRRPLYDNIKETLDAYLQVMLDREAQYYELLKEPRSIEQIAEHRLAFKERIFQMEDFWEKVYIHHHIQHLIDLGSVLEIEPGIFRQV